MNTIARTAQETRPTDRLLEALATVAALLDRTINEVKTVDADFQDRLLRAVHDTETSLQNQATAHLEQALAENEVRLRKEVAETLRTQFEIDMRAGQSALRSQLEEEFSRTLADLNTNWESERQKLNAEIEKANQTAQRLMAEVAKAESAPSAIEPTVLMQEMERVQSLVSEISVLIDDPNTELSTVIRKNVERAELEAYVRGIRFALGK